MSDRRRHRRVHRGYSLVGMLIALACVLVLFTIAMNAMNKRMTGQGSVTQDSVRSFEDQIRLYELSQSLTAFSIDAGGALLRPSTVNGSGDITFDTTANLFSAMVMAEYMRPEGLISANEYSEMVWPIETYHYEVYDPRRDVYWDPAFRADLDTGSNVSFAHLPLFGDRARRHWSMQSSGDMPIIGNRGPRNGDPDPNSRTVGRNGQWAGHLLFADGHIAFAESFTPTRRQAEANGQMVPDNIFRLEEGEYGTDAILSFTREMTEGGPVLQHD